MCDEYSGWTNYPTWCTALWTSNDQGLHDDFQEQARTLECQELAEYIKDVATEETWTLESAGLITDLLTWALGAVNWFEIAEGYIEEARIQGQREGEE